jgi:small basic protein
MDNYSLPQEVPKGWERLAQPWCRAAILLLPWLCAFMMALHLKRTLLTAESGGYEFVSHLIAPASSTGLSILQSLALYRQDFLLVGVIVPAILLLLVRLFGRVVGGIVVVAVSALAAIALYVQVKCFWEVRNFQSLSSLLGGIRGAGREYFADYVYSSSFLKLILLLGSAIGLGLLAHAVETIAFTGTNRARRTSMIVSLLAIFLGIFSASLYAVRLPRNPYLESSFQSALHALFQWQTDTLDEKRFVKDTPDDLLAEYSKLTNAPVPNRHSQYWSKASGYDVIVVVVETMPSACVDFSDARIFPNIAALQPRALVGHQHYSTAPYTSRAVFSIYSSWYPANDLRDFIQEFEGVTPRLTAPGLARSLDAAGYRTAIFLPQHSGVNWEHDQSRFAALGFQEQLYLPVPDAAPSGVNLLEWRRQKDLLLKDMLKQQIRASTAQHARYMFAFHPQLTHGPWPNVSTQSDIAATCAQGLPLFHEVDGWIGEIVSQLKETKTLDHTLILITGDHGIRTRTEHPSFRGTTMQGLSYHVPFLLYAPGILDHTIHMEQITSHIDIAPTLLDLLGVNTLRALEEGSPMWDTRIQNRTTFFLGKWYLGVDAYQERGNVFLYQYFLKRAASEKWEGSLQFSAHALLTTDQATSSVVHDRLNSFSALQHSLARTMAN